MGMLLNILPDELWISILNEWIGKPITLCGFDIAISNRYLRQRYLGFYSAHARKIMFNHTHFAICDQKRESIHLLNGVTVEKFVLFICRLN